jgi:hypothetical protein
MIDNCMKTVSQNGGEKMKKLLTVFLAVLLVFSFVSFAAAQESDPMEGVQVYQGDFKWVPGNLPWQLFIPHYDIGGAWWTGLVLHNMDINANQMTISFCDNDGWTWGTKEVAMTGFQKLAWMVTPQMTGGCVTGWIVVESQFQLLGFVNFGQTGISVTTLGPFFSW